jgi:hypothetical protein
MIQSVNRFRSLVAMLVVVMTVVAAAPSARAAEGGWFDSSAQSAAPAGPPATGERGAPPPLAPSPLLNDGSPANGDAYDQNPDALTKFRPYLDPYGVWVDDPTYGRVWIPNASVVGPNFQPYVSNGRWALDEGGEWIWVSDYSFGWVVFHYGRWVWIQSSGWAWIPGYRYAPAWVNWRVPTGSYDYVGWAPSPPTFVWFGGFSVFWGYAPYYWWVFCPSPYLFYYHVGYYVVTDPYWQGYAAYYTRPYVPASPHPQTGTPATAPRQLRSPSLSAARVPPSAVPAERVSATAPSPRTFSNSQNDAARPSSRADTPSRSYTSSPTRAPMRSFSDRDLRAPRAGSQRLAPARYPSQARPNTRVSPRAMRPQRR